jgi:hypothetical protein
VMSDGQWTSREVQARPREFLKWQEEQRKEAERERKEAAEESDFQSFAKMYEERGGDPSKAREMYRKYRDDMALEAAKEYDRATRETHRQVRMRAV